MTTLCKERRRCSVAQFNEFVAPDEGWNANTNDDIEPANIWDNEFTVVRQQFLSHR